MYALRVIAPVLAIAVLLASVSVVAQSSAPMTVVVYSDGTAVVLLHLAVHTRINGTAYARISGIAGSSFIHAKLEARALFAKPSSQGFSKIELSIESHGKATNVSVHSVTHTQLTIVAKNGTLQVVSSSVYVENYEKLIATQVEHTTIRATGSFREVLLLASMINKQLLQRALEAKGIYFIKINSVSTSLSGNVLRVSISMTIDLKGFAQYLADKLGGNASQYLEVFKPIPGAYTVSLHIVLTPEGATISGCITANMSRGGLLKFIAKEGEVLRLYLVSPTTSLSMISSSVKSMRGLSTLLKVVSSLRSASVELAKEPTPFSITLELRNHVLSLSITTPRLIAKKGRGPTATLAAIKESVLSLVKAVAPDKVSKVRSLRVRIVAGDPRVRVLKSVVKLSQLGEPGIVEVASTTSTITTTTSTATTTSARPTAPASTTPSTTTSTVTKTVTATRTVVIVSKTVTYRTVVSKSVVPTTVTKIVTVTVTTKIPHTVSRVVTLTHVVGVSPVTHTITKVVYTPRTVTKTVIKTVKSPVLKTVTVTRFVARTNWKVVGGMAAVIIGLAIALGVVAARRR